MGRPSARPNEPAPSRLKPGWYLVVGLILYAVVVTALLLRPAVAGPTGGTPPAAPGQEAATGSGKAQAAYGPPGLWFPLPGARLPASDDNLPNAPRAYRHGVSQGFDFFSDDAGVPVEFGTPVVAAQAGQVVRADVAYVELDPAGWEELLASVAETGATEAQLDRLRGRQVWLRLEDGTVLRYGHLATVKGGVRTGVSVYRGQVIGTVGNSGTGAAVAGRTDQARLRFEVWTGPDTFFGAGLEPEAVRMAAASLFVGP